MNHHLIPEAIRQELVVPYSLRLGPLASGGLSGASIWKCSSTLGPVALRCWPPEHPSPERLAEIHSAMRRARNEGVEYVPIVLDNRSGQSYTSDGLRLWEATQWMPGVANYESLPSLERLQAALRALATLHRAWQTAKVESQSDSLLIASIPNSSQGISPTMTERYHKLQASLQHLSHWARIPLDSSRHASLARQTLSHLAVSGPGLSQQLSNLQAAPTNLHFVLRDVWSDHILFIDQRVTGIIDYGAARLDEPATDVARLLGSLEPFRSKDWHIGWEAYQALNPQVDLERVELLDRVGALLSAVQWLQWLVINPRRFDAAEQNLITRWQRLLRRLESWMF